MGHLGLDCKDVKKETRLYVEQNKLDTLRRHYLLVIPVPFLLTYRVYGGQNMSRVNKFLLKLSESVWFFVI